MATESKGPLLEEQFRMYFLSLGYYVARGVKILYKQSDLTDIDLLLFSKSSPLKRIRTNVDIKNKRVPQAVERVFWAKGLQQVLGYDDCIVVTTDKRKDVSEFGSMHNVSVIDGNFISTLDRAYAGKKFRITEEELLKKFHIGNGITTNSWLKTLELAKSRLSNDFDFSSVNSNLVDLRFFSEQYLAFKSHEDALCRAMYLSMSYVLLSLDFVIAKLVSMDMPDRKVAILHGVRYGSIYDDTRALLRDVLKTVENGEAIFNRIDNAMINGNSKYNYEAISEFFSNSRISSKLFSYAKQFEELAYNEYLTIPEKLELEHKSIFAVMLDFFNMPRAAFL